MGLDMTRRRLARSIHAEMTARNYGKYLFLKNRDTIERLFLSYDMLVPEKELERICGEMLHDIFRSIGICIRFNVEVKFAPLKDRKNYWFTISYRRRNVKASKLENYVTRRHKNT